MPINTCAVHTNKYVPYFPGCKSFLLASLTPETQEQSLEQESETFFIAM